MLRKALEEADAGKSVLVVFDNRRHVAKMAVPILSGFIGEDAGMYEWRRPVTLRNLKSGGQVAFTTKGDPERGRGGADRVLTDHYVHESQIARIEHEMVEQELWARS